MTIDNEIKLAQQEKVFNDSVNILMENLGIDGEIQLDEAECLNLKYSEAGEILREFDYSGILNNIVKNGIKTLEEANCLAYGINGNAEKILEDKNEFYKAVIETRNLIESSLNKIENNDVSGYKDLSKICTGLNEAGKEFMKAYNNGGNDYENYLTKLSTKYQKKGMSKEDADKKAEDSFGRRAHNIHVHTGKQDEPDKGRHPFKAQVKKY